MSDRNEWFKDVKRLIRGLEVETVEDPFACPTVKSVTDGEDVLHALGLHPSRDVCGIVNVDIDEVYGLIRHIEPEPVTGSTSDGYHTFDELYHHRAVLFIAWGSMDLPPFRQAVAMLADSWNSR